MSRLKILAVLSALIFLFSGLTSVHCAAYAADSEQAKSQLFSLEPAKGLTPQPEPSKVPSESAFERFLKESRDTELSQFGYGFFKAEAGPYQPAENIPVNPEYVLGPGDELKISVWGRLSAEQSVVIDRDGKVNVPNVGVIYLNGLTFAGARVLLEKEFSRFFLPSEVKVNVTLGALRSIRVYVVGNASRPGSYNLSSLSTIMNAVFAAGGPSKIGSMRKIELKRGGKTVSTFDMYDFLLKGNRYADTRLASEDVIFIPPAGELAAISGNIKAPAIYELKNESTLKDLLELSGGLNEIALKGRVQISRIVDNVKDVVLEKNLMDVAADEVKIQAGDLVKIFTIIPDKKYARVSGAVKSAGEFGFTEGITIKELVGLAGGLHYYAFSKEAELTRVFVDDKGPRTEKLLIDLEKALAGDISHNIILKDNDYLFIRTIPEWDIYKTITISGEVKFPGTYTIVKGERLSDIIRRAGGFTDKAYLKGAEFTRRSVKELQQQRINEAIDRLEAGLLSQTVEGIGSSQTAEDVKQQQLMLDKQRLLIAKMRAAQAKGRITIFLDKPDKLGSTPSDLVLEEGDTLRVPTNPAQVQVIGAVYNQTSFIYSPKATISRYIQMAGGITRQAAEDDMFVLKVDGTAVSMQHEDSWGISWDGEAKTWVSGAFMSARLDPGDTVVVPEDFERVHWMNEVKDLTQILYQIAVTAGVLIVAF